MIKVNLVPGELLAKARQKQRIFQATVAGVALAIVLVVISLMHYYTYIQLQRQVTYDQSELKTLQATVDEVESLQKETAAVNARLDVIKNLLKGRPLYPYFMSDFARSVPERVQVKSLSTAGGGSEAAPLKLNISAVASSDQDIYDWVQRLNEAGQNGAFSSTELGAVTTNSNDHTETFTLTSVYTPKL